MNMPFRWPLVYESLYLPPEKQPEQALWFIFRRGELLVTQGEEGSAALPPIPHPQHLGLNPLREHYLGVFGETHCYAAEAEADSQDPAGWGWLGLRNLFDAMDEDLFALAGRAAQLLEWERTHQYCGACGTLTRAHTRERARECPSCSMLTYPRVTPAIMALVRDGQRLLLGRSRHFRRGSFSVLAGFVEPGETLEQCVTREVREEVGLDVKNVRYFASQPWPFPHQMMIAFFADYAGGELRIDPNELEAADWFEIGKLPPIPGKISLARQLIDAALREMDPSLLNNGKMGIYAN